MYRSCKCLPNLMHISQWRRTYHKLTYLKCCQMQRWWSMYPTCLEASECWPGLLYRMSWHTTLLVPIRFSPVGFSMQLLNRGNHPSLLALVWIISILLSVCERQTASGKDEKDEMQKMSWAFSTWWSVFVWKNRYHCLLYSAHFRLDSSIRPVFAL